jgi:hypothetical protein
MRAPSNGYREQRLVASLASSTRKIPSTSGYPRRLSISDVITFAVHANRSCGGRSCEIRRNGAGHIRAMPTPSAAPVVGRSTQRRSGAHRG